jgi:hypothetical protein
MNRTIAIAINVYNEPIAQVEACLGRISAHLSEASVAVFCNGLVREDVSALTKRYHYDLVFGENLAANSTWHLWWNRMFDFYRQSGAEVCFKFDPDTMVDMVPKAIPSADSFGTVWMSKRYRIPFIQGGVTGLSGRVVKLLLSTGLLHSSDSAAVPLSQYQWDSFADDQHLSMALASLNILPVPWAECMSLWRTPVLNAPVKYAIVHPRYYSRSL